MKLRATNQFRAPAEAVSQMLISPDYQKLLGQHLNAVECSAVAAADSITVTYILPTLEDYRIYAGPELKLTGCLRWTTPLANGRRDGWLRQTAEHFPSLTEGPVRLRSRKGLTLVKYDLTMTVRIPFLSSQLAKSLEEAGQPMLMLGERLGAAWLASHAGEGATPALASARQTDCPAEANCHLDAPTAPSPLP
ncbi:MAG: DUF2505 domain-containing protein [Propionibacteriaceae bacterium]|jgi:hypothetical protein|nr:DUF2505 domain-containing protein [Propionibacteriaceae bacterium]